MERKMEKDREQRTSELDQEIETKNSREKTKIIQDDAEN